MAHDVFCHFRDGQATRRGKRTDLFYWRTRSGNEVDFIVYGTDVFTAIEVKNTDQVRSNDLNGLCAFMEEYPEASALLLYRGRERIKKKGVLYMPVDKFLAGLRPDREISGYPDAGYLPS